MIFFCIQLMKFANTFHNWLINIVIFPATDWENLQVCFMISRHNVFEKHKNFYKSIFFYANLFCHSEIMIFQNLQKINNSWNNIKYIFAQKSHCGLLKLRGLWGKNPITDWGTSWFMAKLKLRFNREFLLILFSVGIDLSTFYFNSTFPEKLQNFRRWWHLYAQQWCQMAIQAFTSCTKWWFFVGLVQNWIR